MLQPRVQARPLLHREARIALLAAKRPPALQMDPLGRAKSPHQPA